MKSLLTQITRDLKILTYIRFPLFFDLTKAGKMGEEDSDHLEGNKEAGKSTELCIYCRPGRLNLVLEKY